MRRTPILPVLLTAVWAVCGCSDDAEKSKPSARPPVLVRVAEASKATVPFVARAPGLIIASETVEVHSRVDSQVVEVHFREGDRVETGQLLFTLDDRAVNADLRRQQATLATLQAELNNARRQYERARKLAAGGFESTAELDKARADFEGSEARTGATRAEIERLQVLIGYTRVTAAITGRAGAITATVGNTVKANDAGAPLVVIRSISPIRVQFGLPQRLLAPLREQVAAGHDSARVIRDAIELPGEGRIEFIDNNINRTTATFECRAQFANADEALWPGMIVEILIRLGEDANVITVPENAVQHGPSGDFVFVIDNATARRKPVSVRRYGEGMAIVTEGLAAGEKIAIDGMLSLSEGTPVEVAGAKAPGAEVAKPAAGAAESAPK